MGGKRRGGNGGRETKEGPKKGENNGGEEDRNVSRT